MQECIVEYSHMSPACHAAHCSPVYGASANRLSPRMLPFTGTYNWLADYCIYNRESRVDSVHYVCIEVASTRRSFSC